MKKLFLIMALGVLGLTCSAQIEQVVLTPVKKGEAPQVLLDSIKKSFPNSISQTLSTITASSYGKAWNVYISPASAEITPLYYHVYLKGKNGNQTLIYDKDGNLLKVKQVIKNTEIPEPVKNTLNTKYTDWTLVGNEERITTAKEKSGVEYKVILKKGVLKKAVFIDPEGNVKVALPKV